jgi:probable addiction module antidote protein
MVKIKPFDTAQHLDNPEVIAGYLAEAFSSADEKLILRAITNVARAQGMSKIARKVGMSRTSLYWQDHTKPEFTTVLKVLAAVGVRLQPKRTVDPDDAEDDDDAARIRMPAGVLMRGHSNPKKFGLRTGRKATLKRGPLGTVLKTTKAKPGPFRAVMKKAAKQAKRPIRSKAKPADRRSG